MQTNKEEKDLLNMSYVTLNELVGHIKELPRDNIKDIEYLRILDMLLFAANNRLTDLDALFWDNGILGTED